MNSQEELNKAITGYRKYVLNAAGVYSYATEKKISKKQLLQLIEARERAAQERLLDELSKSSEYTEKDLQSGGTQVFECVSMAAIEAKRQSLNKKEQ